MTTRCVIAHLSDIHFGNHNPALLNRLEESLLEPPLPDFVVVTGDLSEHSYEPELEKAKGYLQKVVARLQQRGRPSRYLVIPGNHDVGYWKGQRQWRTVFSVSGGGLTEGTCLPGVVDQADLPFCECYPNAGLVFLKFDSNILWGNLLNYANGQVGREQLDRVKQVLDRSADAHPDFKEYRKIALVHHHVHYLPLAESDQLFLMKDAGAFWRAMIEWGVELILHGHKHYSTHAVIRYMRQTAGPSRDERELMILSAGTAASLDLKPNQRNGYYKIECDAFKYKVRHFAVEDGNFVPAGSPIEYRNIPRIRIPGADAIDVAALESILVPEDADRDDNHYFRVIYEATIGRDLSYTKRATFEGRFRSSAPHLNIPFVVAGAPGRLSAVQCSAYDCLQNQDLPTPVLTLHSVNVDKVNCRVSLPPLHDGDRFRVRLEGRVPDLMYRENDYDAVGVARFTGVLEQFEYVLRSEMKPVEPRCFAMHRSGLRFLESDVSEEPLPDGRKMHVVRPRIPNVAALGLGLIFHYRALG
jgi:Calcineurin-like phosphoesterase